MANEQPQAPQVRPHVCPECKQLCQFLYSASNPFASEHYCMRCHKSYAVPEAVKMRAELEREQAQESRH